MGGAESIGTRAGLERRGNSCPVTRHHWQSCLLLGVASHERCEPAGARDESNERERNDAGYAGQRRATAGAASLQPT